jgi:hypothetical protein
VLTDAEWPLRDKFLAALRRKLVAMPNRVAYYPGSSKKHAGGSGPQYGHRDPCSRRSTTWVMPGGGTWCAVRMRIPPAASSSKRNPTLARPGRAE